MGYGRVRRFFAVDLPLAVPVIAAGLRVAAVSNVSIVSVGALIGVPQLGMLFTDGFNRFFPTRSSSASSAASCWPSLFDVVIVVVTRLLTPWQRGTKARMIPSIWRG